MQVSVNITEENQDTINIHGLSREEFNLLRTMFKDYPRTLDFANAEYFTIRLGKLEITLYLGEV